MKNLNLYRIIRYGKEPVAILAFAYTEKDAKRYTTRRYGPSLATDIIKIPIKCGLVLTELERR